jgi:signal peptidase
MVAVESGSMEPVLERGDLVYVMESDRFPGPGANENGVVTYQAGNETGYETFGDYGDVIVFEPNGNSERTPTIHRSMMWVEEGENWVERANPRYLGSTDSCLEAAACPADYDGYITKGDANGAYDQTTSGLGYDVIRPEWVVGTAEVAVPYLGSIRLGAVGGEPVNATAE